MSSKQREALVAVKKLFDGRIMFQPSIRACHKQVNEALAEPPRVCDTIPADKLVEEFCNRFMESCEDVDDKEAVAQYKQLFMQIHLQEFVHWIVEPSKAEVDK